MFKFGADPEFFLIDKATDVPVSALGLVPGTKKEPSPLPNGGSVQVDGLAVEFNTVPAESAKDFADSVASCLSDIRKIVPSKYYFKFVPVITFPTQYFDKLPDSSKELGCDPDFDALKKGEMNPIPKNEDNPYLRTASGHLHIGWGSNLSGEQHLEDCVTFINQMDNWFYYSTLSDYSEYRRDELLRRTMYGKQGAFRPKHYGVEYRTPSNLWLSRDREMHRFLFNRTKHLFEFMVSGEHDRPAPLWPISNYGNTHIKYTM